MKKLFLLICLLSLTSSFSQTEEKLKVKFNGDAQVESGSFYAGLEFHHSSPLPQRISFYYPVANSIDLSRDYWKRDSSFVMAIGLETDGKKEWLGHENYPYTLTPYSVAFSKEEKERAVNISYEFCKDKPAFVLTIEVKNNSGAEKSYKLLTELQLSLRTSHTFSIKDKASTHFDKSSGTLFANFNDTGTQNAELFVLNAGEKPSAVSGRSSITSLPLENDTWRDNSSFVFPGEFHSEQMPGIPAAKFLYEKKLKPGESLKIVQVIGSAAQGEGKNFAGYLEQNYQKEVQLFNDYVISYAEDKPVKTGDEILDRSILWSKAVLAVNKHYIDGTIQPMPCPAEYNFYFTHDVLLTDLAAVYFDSARVKNDLDFIISHADKDHVIPHAYYWKDSAFVTELATPDNWNHFWFIIMSGLYTGKYGDKKFAEELYPCVSKSISETLKGYKDSVMYAYRPDWWDIGRNYGPRSFMTILAIKAIDEYNRLAGLAGKKDDTSLETISHNLRAGLSSKLWDADKKYLMNYFEDGSQDIHYYMGSLLAAHFNTIGSDKINELVNTASGILLDPKLGLYTVYPMDFQNLGEYLKLVGNEAGDPHKYINGGIWPHGNAMYALALIAAGKRDEAINFMKTTMTLDGIINSPNGQPALYEYRNSNKNNPAEYGKVDKPQFMWAAGWYLYCIYELYGK
jgi:hypothetical protein